MTGGTHAPRQREHREPVVVTAIFDSADAVDTALTRLYDAGVPRDLIEVVVSRTAADRFYRDARRVPDREVFRFAGIGGFIGLILGVTISLVILALPGEVRQRSTAIIQLIGPNFMTLGGALVGAIIGFFRRRQAPAHYARAAEASSGIVVAVAARHQTQVESVLDILTEAGGQKPRVERPAASHAGG
ncbi:MAG TPA: hypothetical protein VFS44_13730 [Gemmatimonadaceae bacterium]|nr:hypothetical protein [Gemmatimonadaceae bacterium]